MTQQGGHSFVRVSVQPCNDNADLDALVGALEEAGVRPACMGQCGQGWRGAGPACARSDGAAAQRHQAGQAKGHQQPGAGLGHGHGDQGGLADQRMRGRRGMQRIGEGRH